MPYGSNLFSLLYFVGGAAKLNVSTHSEKGGRMISNRRRLLTAAAVAALLSSGGARVAETVLGTILEEVPAISCSVLPTSIGTTGSAIATGLTNTAGAATTNRSGKRTGASATAKKSAKTAKIGTMKSAVATHCNA